MHSRQDHYAYYKNAPILLTRNDKLTDETIEELKRLNPREIIIVGGEGSINQKVVIPNQGIKISKLQTFTRIPGKDRFEVSKNIAKKLPNSSQAVIANGLVFADALSIAPYASINQSPILLTRSNSIPYSTLNVIKEKGITSVTIVGGIASVNEKVEKLLPVSKRIGGKDRYEVSANIAKELFSDSTQFFFSNRFVIC